MEGLATALGNFVEEAQGLSAQFDPQVVFYIGPWGVTQYIVWLFIALAVTFAVVLVAAKKVSLVPTNKFVNTVEFGYDFVNSSIAEDVIGEGFRSMCRSSQRSSSLSSSATSWASFLVSRRPPAPFSVHLGSRSHFVRVLQLLWHEDFRLLPVLQEPLPVGRSWSHKPVIWFLELFSMVIRVLTLAVQTLWQHACGHMMLAIFSIATTCFYPDCAVLWFYGPHRRLPSIAWFALLCCYVCPRVLGCFHPGVRFRDPCRLPMYPPRCTRTKPQSFGIDRRVVKPPALRGAHA